MKVIVKFSRLNVSNWSDPELANALLDAIQTQVKKSVTITADSKIDKLIKLIHPEEFELRLSSVLSHARQSTRIYLPSPKGLTFKEWYTVCRKDKMDKISRGIIQK